MDLIDLHVHSNASDGSLTPSEVADEAIRMGLKAIALTDHDTVDGIPEILEYTKDKDLEVVPGIEVSCYYKKREIHILGFYIDYDTNNIYFDLIIDFDCNNKVDIKDIIISKMKLKYSSFNYNVIIDDDISD